MQTRSAFVQIRVTPEERATLQRLARAAGLDVSAYMLGRALPPNRLAFQSLVRQLGGGEHRYVLAELNDLLTSLLPGEFADAVAEADLVGIPPLLCNYLAAMVERAAASKAVEPPAWVRDVPILEQPHFASPLKGHRLHLLQASPAPFKRRNLFVDASIGARV